LRIISVSDLKSADLHVDAVYQGGRRGNSSDDPFPLLLNVSNMGGFRYRGNLTSLEMLVLTTSLNDHDWPDALDRETGIFTYYGDNKRPGRALHETPRNGNELLRRVFENAHAGPDARCRVPPILVFANTGVWRDVLFLGLAVPGTSDLQASEDLVAIWKVTNGKRFQNYRARFTILEIPIVSRAWINDILAGQPSSPNAPGPWLDWTRTGRYRPLMAAKSLEYRTKAEQLPADPQDIAIVKAIHAYFVDRPHAFEGCAAALARLLLPDITSLDLTRPARDGGRDAMGQLRIGRGPASITVDFALEAKCWDRSNAVGVRQMSRLLSRLRHRQFGILVTTSYLDRYAYKEIKEDQHPIIVIAASDIAELLKFHGLPNADAVIDWLRKEFPPSE
jgi:Restriction endonuclease AspBHI N-terminal/Restriction endonuclease